MCEQESRRLWLVEGNPVLFVALEMSLLCLEVATFPDSLDALEMCLCARRNYAVPLLNPSSCLSLVCDRFSVDLFPGSGLCAIWCASTTLLALKAYHPTHQLPFQSRCTRWSWRRWLLRETPEPTVLTVPGEGGFWGTHWSLWPVCIQVKGESACEIPDESPELCFSCSCYSPSSYSSSPSSLFIFFAHLLHLVPS